MKTYTITIDESEVVIVSTALARMPYGEVARLIANLQKQINAQMPPTNGKDATVTDGLPT